MDDKGQVELRKGEENWLGARSKLKPMELEATTIMSDARTERTDESEGFNNRLRATTALDTTALSEDTEAAGTESEGVR